MNDMWENSGFYNLLNWSVSENSDHFLKDEKTPQNLIWPSYKSYWILAVWNLDGNFRVYK